MKKTIALVGMGLLALTACGGKSEANPQVTSTPVAVQETPVSTPATPAPAKPSESHTATKTLPYASITVMDTKTVAPTANLPYTFVGFDVKVCATQPMAVTWQGWVLVDTQDRSFTPVVDINELFGHPLPGSSEHPANLDAGKCSRGWISFYNEEKNGSLVGKTLVFGEGLEGGKVEWSLSK